MKIWMDTEKNAQETIRCVNKDENKENLWGKTR